MLKAMLRRPALIGSSAATLLLLTGTQPVATQQVTDQGLLVVRRGDDAIASEEFQIQTSSTGTQVTSTVSYPPRRTRVVITTTLALTGQNTPAAFESITRGGDRVLAQFGPRRVVFRRETSRGESAREYPAAARTLVVSDSIFAPYAMVAGIQPGPVRLSWPREDRHVDYELTVEPETTVVIRGRSLEARRFVLTSDQDRRECWFDSGGRLVRIRIPKDGIEVDRSWDGTTDY